MKAFFLIFILFNSLFSGSFPMFNWKDTGQFAITPSGQSRNQQLELLKEELDELSSQDKEFNLEINKYQNNIKKNISDTNSELKNDIINSDILNKKLDLLTKINQNIIESKLLRKQLLSIIQQHINLIEEYLKDPTFKYFRISPKASYGYEDITELYRRIANQEELVARITEEKKNLEKEIENKKKHLNDVNNSLKEKEKAQKDFSPEAEDSGIGLKLKSEIIDLEKDYFNTEKSLSEENISENKAKLAYLQSQVEIAEKKLKLFKQDLTVVERSFWVDIKDLNNLKSLYEKRKAASTKQITTYSEKISSLTVEEEKKRKEFEVLAKENNIELTDMNALHDWSIDISKFENQNIVYELGLINNQRLVIEKDIRLLEIQKELESIKIKNDELLLKIFTTWFLINNKRLNTQQEINQEIQKYETEKNDLKTLGNSFKEKNKLANNNIVTQTRSLQNIKDKISNIQNNKDEYNKKLGQENVKKILGILGRAETSINKQIDLSGRVIKTYSQIKTLIQDQLKQIKVIITKLNKLGGVLQRSEKALSLQSIKNLGPEITNFLRDLQTIFLSYITQLEFNSIYKQLKNKESWLLLLALIIVLLLLGLGYSFIQHISPYALNIFFVEKYNNKWLMYLMRSLGLTFNFLQRHFFGVISWILVFTLIQTNWMLNIGFIVLFYLFSIFYLCFLASRYLKSFKEYREFTNNIFTSSPFKRRLLFVVGLISYSSIIIIFLSNAYSAVSAGKTNLNTFLFSILKIIIQLSIIFLIGKEELLSIVPTKNKIGKFIYEYIDNYYYGIITFIIVLAILGDPYIGGWGKLVTFVLTGFFLSALLVGAVFWIQKYIREKSYKLFFVPNEEQLYKERFTYSKAWYGLFLVASFLLILFIVIFFGAKIWGQSISLYKLKNLLNVDLFYIKTPDPSNPQRTIFQPFNLVSLIIIFTFIFGGLIVAWAFEKFILQRIFGILFIDPGVQNTVSKITRYFIIVLFFMLGLLKVDLGTTIFYIMGAILIGIAWAIKGPVNDVISYFTILVERSVKIGDYVELLDHGQEIRGVIRKINLRTVVIRRKNSITAVVPNSVVTNNSLYNWNYTSGFFAFPDITLTVTYKADPEQVKAIITKILEENPNILRRPSSVIRLEDFSENGYKFLIRGFLTTSKVLEQWDIASDIRMSLAKELHKAGIRICTQTKYITIEEK